MRSQTEVGKYVRTLLQSDSNYKNREISEFVVAKFPKQTFNQKKLTQFVANLRFQMKSKVSEGGQESSPVETTESASSTLPSLSSENNNAAQQN